MQINVFKKQRIPGILIVIRTGQTLFFVITERPRALIFDEKSCFLNCGENFVKYS